MRALFFLVSFLWVFPTACWALNIPLQNALLIHGEPVGFSTPPHRAKRADKDVKEPCSSHEYKSKPANYCCNKCPAGSKVAKDCSGYGQASQCIPCDNGTYTDIPNSKRKCVGCSSCLSQFGQIVLSDCTKTKDTECGCPEGQYKKYFGSDYSCEECTTCRNGTEAMKCYNATDTICQCFHNFFFDDSEIKSCRPCSECQRTDCKNYCPDPELSRKPEESNGVVLVALAVVIAAIIAAVGVYAVYTFYSRKHSSSSDLEVSGKDAQTTLLIQNQESNEKNLLKIPGYTPEDVTCVVQQPTKQSMNGSLPMPDITEGTAPPCLNSPKVVYAIIECIPISRWREFVRRLGLSNHAIEISEQDYRHYKDAQYAMLQLWITREGCLNAKRDQLFNVLREINLGGCIDKIEEHL